MFQAISLASLNPGSAQNPHVLRVRSGFSALAVSSLAAPITPGFLELCSLRVLFDAVHAAVKMVKTIVIKMLAAAIKEDVALAQRDDALAVAQGVIHLMQRDDHGDAVGLVDVA